VRRGLRALIAVGSWQRSPWRGAIALNWTELGLDPASCRIKLLGTGEGRPPQLLRTADLRAISVPPGNGLLLRIDAPGSVGDDGVGGGSGGGGGGGGGGVGDVGGGGGRGGDLRGSSARRRRGRGKGRGRGRGKRRSEA
jgi:hypothetical protein